VSPIIRIRKPRMVRCMQPSVNSRFKYVSAWMRTYVGNMPNG